MLKRSLISLFLFAQIPTLAFGLNYNDYFFTEYGSQWFYTGNITIDDTAPATNLELKINARKTGALGYDEDLIIDSEGINVRLSYAYIINNEGLQLPSPNNYLLLIVPLTFEVGEEYLDSNTFIQDSKQYSLDKTISIDGFEVLKIDNSYFNTLRITSFENLYEYQSDGSQTLAKSHKTVIWTAEGIGIVKRQKTGLSRTSLGFLQQLRMRRSQKRSS